MNSRKSFIVATLAIAISSAAASPSKADIFDYLRGNVPCEGECMVKLQEATSKFDSKLYEHSYRDLSHQYQATRVCGSEHTVAQSRCLQELLIKAEKKESDIQTKAGSMAAQGVVYGRIDRNNDKEVEGLGYGIDKEIQRLVTDGVNTEKGKYSTFSN